jgi:hypothetical protein
MARPGQILKAFVKVPPKRKDFPEPPIFASNPHIKRGDYAN